MSSPSAIAVALLFCLALGCGDDGGGAGGDGAGDGDGQASDGQSTEDDGVFGPEDVPAPLFLDASDGDFEDRIEVQWMGGVGEPGSAGVFRYRVTRAAAQDGPFVERATVAGDPAMATYSWSDTGLSRNQAFHYKVIVTDRDNARNFAESPSDRGHTQMGYPPEILRVRVDNPRPAVDEVFEITVEVSDQDSTDLTYRYEWVMGSGTINGDPGPVEDGAVVSATVDNTDANWLEVVVTDELGLSDDATVVVGGNEPQPDPDMDGGT